MFTRVAGFFAIALVALIVSTSVASAQANPSAGLTMAGGPGKELTTSRATVLVSLNITFALQNVVCTASSSFPVAVKVTVEGPAMMDHSQMAMGANGTQAAMTNGTAKVYATPDQLNFIVPPGAYGNNPAAPPAAPYRATQTVAIAVESPGLPNVTSHKVHVTATLPAGSGANCRGSAAVPAATSETEFTVMFNNTAAFVSPSPQLPIPWGVAPVALLAALWFTRRRSA